MLIRRPLKKRSFFIAKVAVFRKSVHIDFLEYLKFRKRGIHYEKKSKIKVTKNKLLFKKQN